MKINHQLFKLCVLVVVAATIGFLSHWAGLTQRQSVILTIFSLSILGTLFFWEYKLSFVFIGSGVYFLIGAVRMEEFIQSASLDVILFLVSMMIIVGMMKEAGAFSWLITMVLRIKHLTGIKMFTILMVMSAIFSGLMGEVPSIIIMTMVILDICDFLEVDPMPMVVCSVLATNIGSASTVLGNPVGVLIAARSGLTFEDFITHAFVLSVIVLLVIIMLLAFWYRAYIRKLTEQIAPFQEDKSFLYLITIPPDIKTRVSMGIFAVTIIMIGLHHRLETFFGIEENSLLIMLPVISAGIVLIYRHDKARHYIQHEVEWPSLLFFMFLFAQAGVIHATGIASFFANKILTVVGPSKELLSAAVLFLSGFLSSGLDNVVTVAAFVPIILNMRVENFGVDILWWSLLFGACFGGNISLIGSTANIVALGLLEKERNIRVSFSYWIKVGFSVGIISMLLAYVCMMTLPMFR